MLKILLALLITLDLFMTVLLVLGVIASIKAGGGSILFPGLGLVLSLPFVLAIVFVIEIGLIAITFMLYRYVKNSSGRLA